MSIAEKRAGAVAETVARVREIEAREGVTREALGHIRDALIALARRTELFPPEDSPPPESGADGRLYRLSEDPDHRFALYLNTATRDKNTPPHDHTTWAVVVGLRGEEHNRIYECAGEDAVRLAREVTVRPGTGVCLMPDDIHSIHMDGDAVKMHLHMHGVAIPQQTRRRRFEPDGGWRHFAPHPDIRPAPET